MGSVLVSDIGRGSNEIRYKSILEEGIRGVLLVL